MGARAACAAVLLVALGVHSVLPPGFEDELYCPKGYCQQKKDVLPGYVGPKTAFWQCAREAGNGEGPATKETKPWGTTMGEQIKEALVAQGFTTKLCPADFKARSKDVETALVDRGQPVSGSASGTVDTAVVNKD